MEEGTKEGVKVNGGRVAHAGVAHDCGGFAIHGVRLDQFIDAGTCFPGEGNMPWGRMFVERY
jgi:hypothetical protein